MVLRQLFAAQGLFLILDSLGMTKGLLTQMVEAHLARQVGGAAGAG